jgi:hypothetical protein
LALLVKEEKKLGENHLEVIAVLGNLGRLYMEQKQWDLAEKYYKTAYSRAIAGGGEHSLTAIVFLSNLGGLMREQVPPFPPLNALPAL